MYKLLNALVLVGLALYLSFSVKFYADIDIKLAVFIAFIEICGVISCSIVKHTNIKGQKFIIYALQLLIILMSWFGFVANGLNSTIQTTEKQYKTVKNIKYDNYLDNKKRLETQLNNLTNQLNNYITLDQYINTLNMPSWEDKTNVTIDYNNNKLKLQNDINKVNDDINKLVVPEKSMKIKMESKGFNQMLLFLNEITGVKTSNITIMIYMIIGLISLSMIYLFKYLSSNIKPNILKESSNIQKRLFKVKNKAKHISNIPDFRGIDEARNSESTINTTNILSNISNIPENTEVDNVVTENKNISNIDMLETVTQNVSKEVKNDFSNIPENTEVEVYQEPSNSLKSNMLLWLNDNYQVGDKVSKKDIMNHFSLDRYNYDKLRNDLVNNKVLKTLPNKTMVYNGQNKLSLVKSI